jgi:hypothetical protein
MSELSVARRNFLRGLSTATALSYSRILGANDRINMGLIGCGGRGTSDMRKFQNHKDVDVIAVCDIYGARVDAAQQKAP